MAKRDNIKIEGARIIFRNLSGNPDRFNPQGGKRQFSVVIDDPEFAEVLMRDGWNVKQFSQREEDEEPSFYLPVKANYGGNFPPHIYMITGRKKTLLNEDTVGSLDIAEIDTVDIEIRPYEWEPGRISAYVKTMYVNVIQDDFASKYDFDETPDFPEDLPY